MNYLPLPTMDSPLWEEYCLQVNIVHQDNRQMLRLGSFQLWQCAGGRPLAADELIQWCPRTGCMGVIRPAYELSEADYARIEKLKEQYQSVEPGSDVHASLWPKDIQDKLTNHWETEVACPACFHIHRRSQFQTDYNFRAGFDQIAAKMAEIYRELMHSCGSVFMVKHKHDQAYHAVREELRGNSFDRTRYNKLLETARSMDDLVIYRMEAIHRDAAAGKPLAACFKGFLEA